MTHSNTASNKEGLTQNILRRMEYLQSDEDAVQRLRLELPDISYPRPAYPHTFYRTHFNLIDLHDRYFYKAVSEHHCRDWKKKFLMGLLTSALVNAWVLHCVRSPSSMKSFNLSLAHNLLNITAEEIPFE